MPSADQTSRSYRYSTRHAAASIAPISRPMAVACAALCMLATIGLSSARAQSPVWANPTFGSGYNSVYGPAVCCGPPLTWSFDPYCYGGVDDEACSQDGCRTGLAARRPSTWYGSADFVPLMADPYRDVSLARVGSAAGPVVFTSGDPQGEFSAGGRYLIGRTFANCWQLEFAYQGHYSAQDQAQLNDPAANLAYVFSGFADTDDGTQITAMSRWQMSTAEVNWRTWVGVPAGQLDLQLIVGARYFSMSQAFAVQAVGATTTEHSVSTDNDLYGVQLGLNAKWLTTRATYVDFEMKGALCSNFASANHSGANGQILSDDNQHTSFISDFRLTFNMLVMTNVTLQAGYQAVIANGVALAPQNMSLAPTPPSTFVIDDSGDIVYHGPVLGLTWMW